MPFAPAQHPRTALRLVLVLFALSIPVSGQTPAGQTGGLKDAAKEPFQKGLAAAQQQDWKLAIRYFLEAQKTDPDAPQVWFNLGLASSKLPGYELRALAWFQAYLLAVPDAPNKDAIRQQIAALEVSFESRMGKMIDALEAIPPVRIRDGRRASDLLILQPAYTTGVRLAASRVFIADTAGGLKTFRAITGVEWNEVEPSGLPQLCMQKVPETFSMGGLISKGSVDVELFPMLDALVAAGETFTDTASMFPCVANNYGSYIYPYSVEMGNFRLAQQIIAVRWSGSSPDALKSVFEEIACAASDLNDRTTMGAALVRVEALNDKPEDRLHLAQLMIALHEYDRARDLAAKVSGKESLDPDFIGVLVALGANERADALDKRWAERFRSDPQYKVDDPCLRAAHAGFSDPGNWWGRSRRTYLVNLALRGVKFHAVKPDNFNPANFSRIDAGDETELTNFLQASQNTLTGSDVYASVGLANQISRDLFQLAEEYRRAHGPYHH